MKYKFIQLQLFDVKFLISEEHIFRKQKRTDVYGHVSLVLGFQLSRGNDDLSSLVLMGMRDLILLFPSMLSHPVSATLSLLV